MLDAGPRRHGKGVAAGPLKHDALAAVGRVDDGLAGPFVAVVEERARVPAGLGRNTRADPLRLYADGRGQRLAV